MQSILLSNKEGALTAQRLRNEPVKSIKSHAVRKLYVQKREAFYEAILGPATLVPEGEFDYQWLHLMQQLAERSEDASGAQLTVAPVSIVPTQDSVAEIYEEISRLRPDAVPIIDGDPGGDAYLATLAKSQTPPKIAIRWGLAIECAAAWILEPALTKPGPRLAELLSDTAIRNLKALQRALCEGSNKKTRELHEDLVCEALDTPACGIRAAELFNDVAAIMSGQKATNAGWQKTSHISGIEVWTAAHIRKERACLNLCLSPAKLVPAKRDD
jgi:hypothetical protein